MSVPKDLRFLQTHEWHRLDGDVATIDITQSAADELTDNSYVSLPNVGGKLSAPDRRGEIEPGKATTDLQRCVGGTVTEINSELADNPGLVNTDPYDKGWMLKVRLENRGDWDKLLTSEAYQEKTGH